MSGAGRFPMARGAFRLIGRFAGILSALAYSGANFFLVFALQSEASRFEFGIFALSQVFLQFGNSLCHALFATPILVYAADRAGWGANCASFIKANLIFSVLFGLVSAAILFALGGGLRFSALFAFLCIASFTRTFLRAADLALENYRGAMLADLAYGAIVLTGAVLLLVRHEVGNLSVAVLQIVGCLSVLPILPGVSRLGLRMLARAGLAPYRLSLRDHGRWLLMGILTTEATTNAHSYLVGFLIGPAAYAPLAAMTLLYRPANIVVQTMTQYERPRMAGAIARGAMPDLARLLRLFRSMSAAACVFNVMLVGLIVWRLPELIGKGGYERSELIIAGSLLAIITFARGLRGPEAAALQAGGHFRALSMITLYTAPISLVATAFLVALPPGGSAAWSLAGIAIGELAMSALCRHLHVKVFHLRA